MKTIILPNKLKLIYVKKDIDSVTIQVSVRVGSNYEPLKINGISHFTEHMMFEGTQTRSALEISNTIESKGGMFNAATTNERTFFYVRMLQKYVQESFDILSDMMINPIFDEKLIEKERNVVLQEIDVVNDQPRFYQWILFQRALFSSALKNPIYGRKEVVKSLSRNDFITFHKKYYVPNNMALIVVGNVKNIEFLAKKYFGSLKPKKVSFQSIKEPANTKNKSISERRKLNQTYLVYGCKTPKRYEKGSYAMDILQAVLARGQSGRLFDVLRNKYGLAYDVGVYHDPSLHTGVFAAFVATSPNKTSLAKKLIQKEFGAMTSLSQKELDDAKSYIEGSLKLEEEDPVKLTEMLGNWEQQSSLEDMNNYLKNIKRIPLNEVRKLAQYYLGGNMCQASILPKTG